MFGNGEFQILERKLISLDPKVKRIREKANALNNDDINSLQGEFSEDVFSLFSDVVTVLSGVNKKVNEIQDTVKSSERKIMGSIWGTFLALLIALISYWFTH